MADARTYDVIIFGATGFTGRLIAEYMAQHAPVDVRWAIAGRNRDRLSALSQELSQLAPATGEVATIHADNRDWASMAIMANQTKVVLSSVGPYVNGGEHLVRACVTSNTDYVDITGEPVFVDRIINQFDTPAREQGIRIVPCCAFDSIPHDLGVQFTIEHLPADVPVTVEGFVEMSGQISGGTWRSAVLAMSDIQQNAAATQAMLADARQLAGIRRIRMQKPRVRYQRQLGAWSLPMPTIDPLIVCRSAAMLHDYGPDFAYGHYAAVPSLRKAAGLALGTGAVATAAQIGALRGWLMDRKPAGQGPSREQIARGHFAVTFAGRAGASRVVTQVSGGDPGYGEAAKMAAEAALCLVQNRNELPERAGVLTPAAAMGKILRKRLMSAGMRFELLQA